MRVFVTGATGFVGSAVVPELVEAGHEVTGLARSEKSAEALAAAGAKAHRGSLEDLDALKAAAGESEGVIHCAFIHDDFTKMQHAGEVDHRAIEALCGALAGSNRPLVITSGTALPGLGRPVTEADSADPEGGNHRLAGEQLALSFASQGVRSSVVRLPPTVHGEGDHGFVPHIVSIARERGVSGYVGDGANRWPAVHRLDAAKLFRLALEDGPAGSVFHAIGEEGVPTREIAESIARGLGVRSESISPEQALEQLGWIGGFFALDVPATAEITKEQTGWEPTHQGLLADLAEGHYYEERR